MKYFCTQVDSQKVWTLIVKSYSELWNAIDHQRLIGETRGDGREELFQESMKRGFASTKFHLEKVKQAPAASLVIIWCIIVCKSCSRE